MSEKNRELQRIKWAVLSMDVILSNVKILCVFDDIRDAIVFMNNCIDANEEWKDESYFRKIHNNTEQCSIYKTNWMTEKTLIHRYFTNQYNDTI